MPIVDVNIDVPEPTVLEEGQAQVRITAAEIKKSNAGKDMIALVLQPVNCDQPNISPIFHYLMLPQDGDDDRKVYNKQLQLKRFCQCFDYDPAGNFDTDELIDREGQVLLGVEESDEYGKQNRVKRFLEA